MINFFQSTGIVFSIIMLVLFTVAAIYLGYIVVIGLILASLFYITHSLVSLVNGSHT
jgi:hypothetical protein